MTDGLDYSEKKCCRCGKSFIVHGEWAFYKKDNQWWCSWSCMRADEKKREETRGTKRERRERIQQAIRDGLTVNEIVALLGVDRSVVNYWWRKLGNDD